MTVMDSSAILPQAPDELKRLSAELEDRIRARIQADGPIPFSHFMEMALYEPGLGYYSAGLKKFGEGGDFVTAPELGSVFARCLARQIAQVAGEIKEFCLLEIGAGSGQMAVDLLTALKGDNLPWRYMILERSADLKKLQLETIRAAHPDLIDLVEWLDQPPSDPWQGMVIANEVIDALPVERFRVSAGRVQQALVGIADGKLEWTFDEAPDFLVSAVERLSGSGISGMPDGYTSEISLLLTPWLESISSGLQKGYVLLIDYGYARREYYSEQRSMGTLICHYRHRAHDDPFFYPGLQDISAFVDFTALAEAGDACGLDCAAYTSQAMFLLGCGLEGVLQGLDQLPEKERLLRAAEVRRLTMPGEMGEKFQVMALGRGLEMDLHGFKLLDLRHRL